MHKKSVINKLKKVGISAKESKIYITLLEIGPSSVLQISRSVDIPRSSIYPIIESLSQKGLIRVEMSGMKDLFAAESPQILRNCLEQQQKALDLAIPELENLRHQETSKNTIKFYQGKAAMKSAYENLLQSLKPSSDYLVFGNLQAWHDTDPENFTAWPKKRQKIIKTGRSIYFDSPLARDYQSRQNQLNTNVKILPEKKDFEVIKVITSEFIFIHKTGKPNLVIMLENPEVVKMYREMFEIIWDILT